MEPQHLKDVVKSLGRDALAARLGVTQHSIRAALLAGVAPASWYAVALAMARERGLPDPPVDAFNFRPATAPASEDAA